MSLVYKYSGDVMHFQLPRKKIGPELVYPSIPGHEETFGTVYPHVPDHEDTFYIQILEWFESIDKCEYHRGSPRRSSAMRKAWNSGLHLGILRCWLHELRNEENKDVYNLDTFRDVMSSLRQVVWVCEICRQGPEEAMAAIQEILPIDYSNQLAEAEEMYHKFCEAYRRRMRGLLKLTVLLYKARERAIERLYEPGGQAYQKCKESFENCQRKMDSRCNNRKRKRERS